MSGRNIRQMVVRKGVRGGRTCGMKDIEVFSLEKKRLKANATIFRHLRAV